MQGGRGDDRPLHGAVRIWVDPSGLHTPAEHRQGAARAV